MDDDLSLSLKIPLQLDESVLYLPNNSNNNSNYSIKSNLNASSKYIKSFLDQGDEGSSPDKHAYPIHRIKYIGKGSSSAVYQSILVNTMTLIAEKVVVVGDSSKRTQLINELESLKFSLNKKQISDNSAEAIESLDNIDGREYIVNLIDVIPNPRDGTISVCLEYLNGGSLQDIINNGGCSNEKILLGISTQMLKGLHYLHSKRIIHRDLKPSNTLFSSNGVVKIADFGLAKTLTEGNSLADSFVGTYDYMSPERLNGQTYSFPSDIWSYGLTIHTVAIGYFPYIINKSDKMRNFWTISQAIIQDKGHPLPSNEIFSSDFIDFIRCCCMKDPNKRYTTTQLFAHSFISNLQTDDIEPVVSTKSEGPVLRRSKSHNQPGRNINQVESVYLKSRTPNYKLSSNRSITPNKFYSISKNVNSAPSKSNRWSPAVVRRPRKEQVAVEETQKYLKNAVDKSIYQLANKPIQRSMKSSNTSTVSSTISKRPGAAYGVRKPIPIAITSTPINISNAVITQSDNIPLNIISNTPNHKLELSDFSISNSKNKIDNSIYSDGFDKPIDEVIDNVIKSWQVYIIQKLKKPIDNKLNGLATILHSIDRSTNLLIENEYNGLNRNIRDVTIWERLEINPITINEISTLISQLDWNDRYIQQFYEKFTISYKYIENLVNTAIEKNLTLSMRTNNGKESQVDLLFPIDTEVDDELDDSYDYFHRLEQDPLDVNHSLVIPSLLPIQSMTPRSEQSIKEDDELIKIIDSTIDNTIIPNNHSTKIDVIETDSYDYENETFEDIEDEQ